MKLWRPHIPVEIKCRVALRQLGEMWPDKVIEAHKTRPSDAYLKGVGVFVPRGGLGVLLSETLDKLADLLGCNRNDLRLDHDPPLAARPQHRKGLGRKTYYLPDANDPNHLFYRPHGPQFVGSHLIKTNVRGDNGQFPDRVLIKRERRRQEKAAGKPERKKAKIKSRGFSSESRTKLRQPKRK